MLKYVTSLTQTSFGRENLKLLLQYICFSFLMLFVKRFRAGPNRKHSVFVHNLRNGGFGYGVPAVFQNRINFTASENFVVIAKYLFDNGKHF